MGIARVNTEIEDSCLCLNCGVMGAKSKSMPFFICPYCHVSQYKLISIEETFIRSLTNSDLEFLKKLRAIF